MGSFVSTRQSRGKGSIALVVSIAAHAALIALARPVISAPSRASDEPADAWAGVTTELGGRGEQLVDVSVDSPPRPQVAPAPPPLPSPKPVVQAPSNDKDAPTIAVLPKPKPIDAPRSIAPKPAVKKRNDPPPSNDRPQPKRNVAARASSKGNDGEGEGNGAQGQRGGSEADQPGAPRDLGRAFTRAIPAACQADPVWSAIPLGDAGAIEVTFQIDSEGHLSGDPTFEGSPPKHLANLVRRTKALLDAGVFALRGASNGVRAGSETLRLRVSVSEGGDSEAGGAAGLAFHYAGKKGKASFTQPTGRHVDVQIEVVKIRD